MTALPHYPFDSDRVIGTISEVAPTSAKANLPQAATPEGSWLHGTRVGAGELGEFVLIECGTTALFGRIVNVRLPERERLSVEAELGVTRQTNPVGTIQLLTGIDTITGRVKGGIQTYPRVGAKVYSAHPILLKWIAEAAQPQKSNDPEDGSPPLVLNVAQFSSSCDATVSLTPERLFGRHCAVLGATGGGKSLTLARLIEESSRLQAKVILIDATGEFYTLGSICDHLQVGTGAAQPAEATEVALPYFELTEQDLFALFKPSGQTQVPKLRGAMKSLKLAKVQPQLATGGIIAKTNQPRAAIEAALMKHAKHLDDPRANFDITLLTKQIFEECVWPTGKTTPGNWGLANDQEKSYCVSLVSRIEDMTTSSDLACIFQPGGKPSVFGELDEFLGNPNPVLRISMKYVPFANHAREILVNAIGRYLLKLARGGSFKDRPVLVVLDEAHNFISHTLEDEYSKYPLDAFELVAKEGRKFSLMLCLATQRPRDLDEGVLSQVGTLIVHRLTNDRDREVVERASGDIDRSAAVFLPTLSPGEAVIVGVDFPFPLTIQVNQPARKPDSRGPDFQRRWAAPTPTGATAAAVAAPGGSATPKAKS